MPEPRTYPPGARARILALSAERDRGRAYAEAMFRLGFELGRGIITDPEAGYAIGFDTGLSARQDTRAFVHAVRTGFVNGNRIRREWVAKLLEGEPPCATEQTSPAAPTPAGSQQSFTLTPAPASTGAG